MSFMKTHSKCYILTVLNELDHIFLIMGGATLLGIYTSVSGRFIIAVLLFGLGVMCCCDYLIIRRFNKKYQMFDAVYYDITYQMLRIKYYISLFVGSAFFIASGYQLFQLFKA